MGQFLPSGISLGGSFKASFTAPSGPSSAIVSGAGTSLVNGTYPFFSTLNGKPAYDFGGSGNPESSGIFWDGGSWLMRNTVADLYSSSDNVAFPWLATWDPLDGDPPSPTVTES